MSTGFTVPILILFLIAVAYTIFLIGALTHDRKLVIITLFILFTLLLITSLIILL